MVVVDHLQVEGEVGVVDPPAAPLVVATEVVPLLHAVAQVVLNLLHVVSHVLDLRFRSVYIRSGQTGNLAGI